MDELQTRRPVIREIGFVGGNNMVITDGRIGGLAAFLVAIGEVLVESSFGFVDSIRTSWANMNAVLNAKMMISSMKGMSMRC